MINPAKYDSALKQMTDQQLQLLMKRPDKIPTQFVVKELNRRQQMRRQAKAQEASLSRSAGQPMQMGNEQSMAMMGGQQQQPRMMSGGGITKLQSGTMTNYVTEIQEAFGRGDFKTLKNIMDDNSAPAPARQLAEKLFAQNPLSGGKLELLQENLNPLSPDEVEKQINVQKNEALDLETAGGALDMSDSGFDVKLGTPFMEGVRKTLRGGRQFLGIDEGDVNIDSPIGIDKFASGAADFISDKAKAAYTGIKSNLLDLSPEAAGEKEIERRKKLQAARNELEKANTLMPSLQFESGIQPKEDNEFINLNYDLITDKTSPGPRQGNLTDNSIETPLPKPFENNKIKNSAAETFTGTIVANANTDLSTAGDVDTTNKGIKNNIISQEVKNMFDSDFTQKLAMDGYEKSNYLVKAGEIFDGLSEDNKKIVALHNEQTKDLVKQREEMLKMMDSMKRSPENIAFQSLIDMGLSLMASPEANFAQALGKAGQVGMKTFRGLAQEEKDRVFKRYKMAWDLSKAERDHQMQGLNLAKQHKLNMITGHTKLHQMEQQDENNYFNRAHTAFNTQINQAKLKVQAAGVESLDAYRDASIGIEKDKLERSREKDRLDALPDDVKKAQWYMGLGQDDKKAAQEAFKAMNTSSAQKDDTNLKLFQEWAKFFKAGTEPYDDLVEELTKTLGKKPTTNQIWMEGMRRAGLFQYSPETVKKLAGS
jgi:hypothetical protein